MGINVQEEPLLDQTDAMKFVVTVSSLALILVTMVTLILWMGAQQIVKLKMAGIAAKAQINRLISAGQLKDPQCLLLLLQKMIV